MAEGIMAKEKRRFQTVRRKTWLSAVLIITFRRLGNEIEGNIYNIHIPEAIPFRGMGDMIVKMERIYDLLGYPQAEFRIRHRDDEGKWDGTLLENDALWNYDKTVQGWRQGSAATRPGRESSRSEGRRRRTAVCWNSYIVS